MRRKRALLFLLTSVVVGALFAQQNATTVKRKTLAEFESSLEARRRGISESSKSRLVENFNKQPLRFEANQGQTDTNVKFFARGPGYRVFLTGTEAVVVLNNQTRKPSALESVVDSDAPTLLQMRLAGASPRATAVGVDKLPGVSNYFLGNDANRWRTQVPAYTRVRCERIYPGIDLIYHGNQSQIEYDFEVQPGADVRAIGMEMKVHSREGEPRDEPSAHGAHIDMAGNLVLATERGELVFHKPVAYQLKSDSGGNATRSVVDARYVLTHGDQVGFEVGKYDSSKQLIIDPILSYSTYLGGTQDDLGNAITVDRSGSVYVTGATTSANFPVTSGVLQSTYGGGTTSLPYQGIDGDVFVTKLSPDGSALVWSTYIGGAGDENAYGIAVDATGVYLTGGTNSSDYPVTPSAYQPSSGGLTDVFVTKLDPAGAKLLYSTHIGVGGEGIRGFSIAVDGAGSAYVAGNAGPGFPTTPGAFQTASNAFTSGYVMELNPTGSAAEYCTFLSGLNVNDVDYAEGIAIDKNGNAYITGWAGSSTFPLTAGAYQNHNAGTHDAFFAVLNSTGSALLYSTYLGGAGDDEGFRIAVDGSGMAYIAGVTASTDFPTSTGALQTVYGGGAHDAFIAKLDPTKSGAASLVYSTYLGGSGDDNNIAFPWGLFAVDSLGNAHITGGTTSTDFPTVHALQATSGGGFDAFVAKLNPAGSALIYSTYLGGSGDDIGRGIAVDSSGNVYVTGQTSSSNFPVSANAYQKGIGGASDAFVAKIVPIGFVSPTSLTFANQAVGTTSAAHTFTLTNEQNTALDPVITTSGDFAETDTCGASLGPSLSCTVSVTFAPTYPLTRTGAVAITDNAANSPQTVMLSGVGVGPAVSFGQNSFNVGRQLATTSSAAQTVNLTNAGNAPLTISSIAISGTNSGDFTQTNNCPGSNASLAPNSNCTISLIFTPAAAGSRTASVTVTDNAPASPQSLDLQGTGTDFSIAAATGTNCPSGGNCSAAATIKAGQTATYNLEVTPTNGFAGTVSFSCTGAPMSAMCKVSPASVTVSAASGTAFVVSLSNTSSVVVLPFVEAPGIRSFPAAFGLLVLTLMLMLSLWRGMEKKPVLSHIAFRVRLVLCMAACILVCACGGGSAPPTNATLTITGTSTGVSRTLPVNITVNH